MFAYGRFLLRRGCLESGLIAVQRNEYMLFGD